MSGHLGPDSSSSRATLLPLVRLDALASADRGGGANGSPPDSSRAAERAARLGLLLYGSSTAFNAGQSAFAKLLGAPSDPKWDCGGWAAAPPTGGRPRPAPRQPWATPPRAGQSGFPVFETVLARSLFILACAGLSLCLQRIDPRGHMCALQPVEQAALIAGAMRCRPRHAEASHSPSDTAAARAGVGSWF